MKTTARTIIIALIAASISAFAATNAFSWHQGHGFGPRVISSFGYVPATVYGGMPVYTCDPYPAYTYAPIYRGYGFWPPRHRHWRPVHRW